MSAKFDNLKKLDIIIFKSITEKFYFVITSEKMYDKIKKRYYFKIEILTKDYKKYETNSKLYRHSMRMNMNKLTYKNKKLRKEILQNLFLENI